MVEVKLGPKSVDLPYTLRIYDVTEARFNQLTDEDTKAEYLDGVMIVHSPVYLRHNDLGNFIRTLMRAYASQHDAGQILGPLSLARLRKGRRVAPDVCFLRKNRVPFPLPRVFKGVPDMTLEILSPCSRDYDLKEKRLVYRAAGVMEIWFVDPQNRQVLIDRRRGEDYEEQVVSRGKVRSEVLRGFWLEASWLWKEPLPSEMTCLQQILGSE
jgi:Uma2 family endonuclease